ncbi:MAG: dephospho-CoA kinase [Alphaproteobacteria bacterium]|nr:dephospho-CoA kinase [Alphaproteobacteria bacterium]
MLIIGLTGSIGMGKSTAASIFRSLGVPVHDSDACVHELYRGPAVEKIEQAFPGATANGAVDRAKLGGMVLGNAEALKKLESIVHPLVAASRDAFLSEITRQGHHLAVFDIPLLFETGAYREVDLIAVVSTDFETQKHRVLQRPGMSEEKFSAIVNRQTPDAEKRRRAHVIIDTNHSIAHARQQIETFLRACVNG